MPSISFRDHKPSLDTPIYKGSVQNLHAAPGKDGYLISETTSGGSVFDIGTIYHIPGSDIARAAFRHYVFTKLANPKTWQQLRTHLKEHSYINGNRVNALLDRLCEQGAHTHHAGMLDSNTWDVKNTDFPDTLSNLTLIRNFHINKPQPVAYANTHFFDYASYRQLNSFVIPLEYIVRFGVTSGSSILNIYHSLQGKAKSQYLSELGQTKPLKAWSKFETLISDFTTKYEPSDRSVSKQEAALISSVSGEQFVESIILTQLASFVVQHLFQQMGLYLWDLKWELAKQADKLVFVDTIDTDSVRATLKLDYQNHRSFVHFNKQSMRDYYKIMHADWYAAINDAKNQASATHRTFLSILQEGQETNHYPQTPDVDPRFLAIQGNKFNFIKRFVLENGQADNYQAEATKIAHQEIDFYADSGQLEQYLSLNGC